MSMGKYTCVSVFVLAVAPGCDCSHPNIVECSGDACVGPKSEHEVICECGIDTILGDAQFDLRICLPSDLNNETGSADEIAAIEAMTDQEYQDAVTAYCVERVAPALHDVVGFLDDRACGSATVTCKLKNTPSGSATAENAACDLPCAAIDCVAPPEDGAGGTGGGGGGGGEAAAPNCDPEVVAPDIDDIHPEFCKCTQADGCGDIAGESICIQPTWAPDPPTIAVGMMTRFISLPSDIQLDHSLSNAQLTVTVDPDFPCGSDTETVTTQAQGSLTLYGQPCAPGDSCKYLLDFDLFADPFSMSFDTGFPCGGETANVTEALVRGGTEGSYVTIDANGNGVIPAGAMRVIADGILNGSDRFKFDSFSTEPVAIHVNFATGTFEMPSATLTFDGGEITVNLAGAITGQPPRADAGADQMVECTSPAGATVGLNGSASSDPDGDIVFYNWWKGAPLDKSGWLGGAATLDVAAPMGPSSWALTVSDQRLATHHDRTNVNVVDTTGPTLSVNITPSELSPPNHKLVTHQVSIVASDVCDPAVTFVLKSITSDEAADGSGDGNTSPDIQGADIGTPDLEFQLRAERKGNGVGRTYTIVYTATDSSGNSTDTVVMVQAPHDQGN